ncbi:PREDICTED: uncharacterized protein LOC108801988 [Nanorana parkeri]|uniref:uncharacterized protein LOC108801988 n=1 Tax=Nanorana parkeri TaxID=125878 RepID=UPI0008542257|nr:PREDICTED: uncharacterized protein LOC108801988 [Nanorana parkeri]
MTRIKVAICSRDSEENYNWLKDFLEKRMCRKTKIEVHPVYITNNTSQFYKEVSGYHFAILYHTKKRGRINITNVTDSLYDQELQHLSGKFGRNHVAVVVDDLESSDHREKEIIINGQPDLKKHAGEVFLFTERDKDSTEERLIEMRDKTMKSKLKALRKYIKKSKGRTFIFKRIKDKRDQNSAFHVCSRRMTAQENEGPGFTDLDLW